MTPRFLLLLSIGAILLLAGVSRSARLGRASLYVDEYLHVTAARHMLTDGQPRLPSGNLYRRVMPYTVAVAASFKLFGAHEWSARLPSVVAGIILVLAVYAIGARWFGRAAGLVASLIVAVSPLCIEMARFCRMYAWFQLVYLVVVYGAWQWVVRPGRTMAGRVVGAVVAIGLLGFAAILQNLAGVFVVALGGFVVGLAVRRPRSAASLWLLAGVAGLALLWFLEPALLHSVWAKVNYAPSWAANSRYHVQYYWDLWRADFPALLWLALPLIGWFVWRYRRLGWYVAAMALVPLLLHSYIFDWKSHRYVVHLFPIFALAVSPGLAALGQWLWEQGRRARIPAGLLACGLTVVGIGLIWPAPARAVQEIRHADAPAWRETFLYIAAHRQPGEVLITSEPLAAQYYLGTVGEYTIDNYGFCLLYTSPSPRD